MTAGQRERLAAFLVTAVVFLAILWPELHYVPIWDGQLYASCAIDAAAHGPAGLTMEALRCGGHPSQGYIVFLAASQLLRFGDITALHVTNILLGLLALASIRVVLARVIPDPARVRQLDLVTLLCAVHPVVLSTLLQVNVDFGVYVFFFATLAALMSERFWLAAIAGVLLCFSKETGVLAYALMVGLHLVFRMLPAGSPTERARRALPLWMTPLPVVLFGAHVLWWNATHANQAVWHGWQQGTLDGFRFFDLGGAVFAGYASGIFVLGFMWVVSAVIAADLLRGGVRMARRLPDRAVSGADPARLAYLGVLTFLLAYLLMSFRTWSNLRYFALLYPLLVILAFASMLRLGMKWRMRTAALLAIGALFVMSVYRSWDPVSRAVYGTFDVGRHDMYRMSSFSGVYAGRGRDELVYNLQFTGFHWALNALYAAVRPGPTTTIVFPRSNRWGLWSPLDARTFERVAAGPGTVTPDYADEATIADRGDAKPRELWFVQQPNDTDSLALQRLHRRGYADSDSARYTAHGLTVTARHLVR
ncbi:MAG: hypothetical protein ACHQQR_10940, partial [Gemmatimonadales bacterium]